MKKIFLLMLALTFVACTPMKPALSVTETTAFPVKGRQGLLIRQKISFGDYKTTPVKRSWTRSGNTRVDLLSGQIADPSYPNLISIDYANSDQSFYFSINDFFGNVADVYAVSEFRSEDLQIGDNPNSAVNILEDIFGGTGFYENIFYLQVFLNNETQPWQLLLDNHASQWSPKDHAGFFVNSEEKFYTLQPIIQVHGKNGIVEVPLGSIGYEIFNSDGRSVAAVSLIDNGEVYLHTKDPSERILLSALCAALLLQQDVSDEGI